MHTKFLGSGSARVTAPRRFANACQGKASKSGRADTLPAHHFGSCFGFWGPLGVLCETRYVLQVFSSLDNIIPLFERTCVVSWRCLFVSHLEEELAGELDQELAWALSRKKSAGFGKSVAEARAAPEGPFLIAMTPAERANAEAYPPDECGMLNQTVAKGFGISSTGDELHCVIHYPALHHCTDMGRWLSGSEMLMANGIPVLMRHGNPRGTPFRCSSFVGGILSRSRQVMTAQSGNTINVAAAGFMQLYCLLFCHRADESATSISSLRLMGCLGNGA
jgi:hypothetical protein